MATELPKVHRTPGRKTLRGKGTGYGRHLTNVEKAHIVELWEAGNATLADLAKKYKKTPDTISKFLKKVGAKKGARAEELNKEVREEMRKSMVDEAVVIANRIKETKEEHYKMATGLSKLLWNTIAEAKKEGKRLDGAIANEIKSYKNAAETLRITRMERYTILNVKEQEEIDRPLDLPQLVVQELTAEEVQKMNQAQRVSLDDVGEMWDAEMEELPSLDDRIAEGEDDDDYTDMEEDDGSLGDDDE